MRRYSFVLLLVAFAFPTFGARNGDADRSDVPVKNWPVAFDHILPMAAPESSPRFVAATDAFPTAPSHFIAVTPCRIVDTRGPTGAFGGPPFSAAQTRSFIIPSGPCAGLPPAAAYSLNFSVVNYANALYFLTAYPTGTTRPVAASMTYGPNPGFALSNAAIVPAGAGGSIDIYTSGSTDLIIDINGYFVEGVVTNVAAGGGLIGGGTGNVALSIDPNVAFKNQTNVWSAINTFTIGLSMNGQKITNLANPSVNTDAANKLYVDSALSGGSPGAFVSFEPGVVQTGTQGRSLINLQNSAAGAVPMVKLLQQDGQTAAHFLSARFQGTLSSASVNQEMFRVQNDGGLLATGQIGIGTIPATGSGWRLMWHPFKVAFRAGYADAGGQFDDANIGFYSWAGGALSSAPGNYAFAMGNQNLAEAQCSVALGSGNFVFGNATDGFATCGFAGGLNNKVFDQAGVTLGQSNRSNGNAAVALGYTSYACGDYSMAVGYRANTTDTDPVSATCTGVSHTGAKIFSDASTTDYFNGVANNEFAVRAAGGFRFRTNATLTTGCNLPAGSGVFSCASDRNLKNDFAPLDGEEVLTRLARIPIETWSYKTEIGVRHAGPVAQDFYAAFHLGTDDKSIGHLDEAGIALKAAQALEARTSQLREALDARTAELRAAHDEIAARDAKIEILAQRLERLERLVTGQVSVEH